LEWQGQWQIGKLLPGCPGSRVGCRYGWVAMHGSSERRLPRRLAKGRAVVLRAARLSTLECARAFSRITACTRRTTGRPGARWRLFGRWRHRQKSFGLGVSSIQPIALR